MDYIELFQNLRTNNKYGRKSPHKAVLMLTVIELYEQNVLSDNEICYDDTLKSMFLKVWNRVLPNEPLFHPEAYLPFWYLQSDSFWHIVPNRGKEDILSLMRDTNIKPSEAKLYDCVKYAELDEDLFFLMTLPSGRSSLKRALLETYTQLSEDQIDRMAESVDNAIDYSASALSDYKKILSKETNEAKVNVVNVDEEMLLSFNGLSEDLQITLNYEYYSFLKKHRSDREMFKEVCPTVFDLYHNIVNHPIRKDEITPSVAFLYDNFLSDLKIALMSEDGAMELIDNIGDAIDLLRGNTNNVEISQPVAETKEIEPAVSDIEDTSYYDEVVISSMEYTLENKANRCYILNNRGERVFSSDGEIIRLNGLFYRLNYSDSLVSMYIIREESKGLFILGRRILSAHSRSPLYDSLDKHYYLTQFKAVRYDSNHDDYNVQVDDRWYGYSGFYADFNGDDNNQTANINNEEPSADSMEVEHVFLDSSGKIIEKITSSQYDISAENRRGKSWTKEEEDLIARYFQQGMNTATIAENLGRTEVAIKSRLAKLGLIEYTYGQEEKEPINNKDTKISDEDDFRIENSFVKCSIFNKDGEKVFSEKGKLKYIGGKLYRFNLKNECFTIKRMQFDGSIWLKGEKKIVAYPRTELYRVMDNSVYYIEDVEDIVDAPVFENCQLKVKGIWYKYNGDLISEENGNTSDVRKRESNKLRILKSPLYAVRKQAILRAMSFFRLPAKIKDIARTISRTAWRSTIKEDEVEDIINTISEVESVDGGYILRKKH